VTTLFISDLHLDAGEPETIRRFVTFIETEARAAHGLYILGDLFEAWVGDDEDDPRLAPVQASLAELTHAGVPCALMHGNRDFLIGPRFCAATGCRLLGDYERVDLYGSTVLLTHGDLLCTDDTRYMSLRGTLRNPAWQRDFLAKSLAERRKIAADLRQLSAAEIAAKSYDIMDVNQATVENVMREHDVSLLLHGHTHRPAIHQFTLDGKPAARIVLGAWHESPSIARWDEHGYRLDTLD
jgi:UDP-2,3-diacylglucosamine hydrolase